MPLSYTNRISFYLLTYLFIYLFICLFIYLLIYLFIYLFTYLFIYLFLFERKILRRKYGPIRERGQWRKELYNEPNIVNVINSSTLRWVGHVVRMDDSELPENILWTNPGGQRERGRPKSRWIDGVVEDARELGCRNWPADVRDKGRWRRLLQDMAHPGL
jgi:hypothetical protein